MQLTNPIGVFDSGVGGLSVLRHLQHTLPNENLIYIADQVHVPYGSRERAEILYLSEGMTRFLLDNGAKIIVVACNTATAAALHALRQIFPGVPFVGMEPAVKPAALTTKTGKVGVLATQNTFASPRYANLMSRFAVDVQVYEDPCLGLVPLIEAGRIRDQETESLLNNVLNPMIQKGIDTLVLGCTHYPFVRPILEKIIIEKVGRNKIMIIDPAPAVAKQARKVGESRHLLSGSDSAGVVQLLTTGSAQRFSELSFQLSGQKFDVQQLSWRDGKLVSA